MSNFRVGQKLVCVDDKSYTGRVVSVVRNREYTIDAVWECRGFQKLVLSGLAPYPKLCRTCGNIHQTGHDAFRFRPVVEDLTAELASSWKESVPTEQEQVNQPQHA